MARSNGTPRDLLWEAMCNADYLTRYYGELGSTLEVWDTRMTFGVLFLSSATVVSFIDKIHAKLPEAANWISLGLAVLTAASSLWLALRRYTKTASLASYLSSRWSQSQWEYEQVWALVDELKPEEILHRLQTIRSREVEWDHVARREMPRDPKIQTESFEEMISARFPQEVREAA